MRFSLFDEIKGIRAGVRIASTPSGSPTERDYPIRIRGQIDPDCSRWQWLIRCVLVIPHALILTVLWLAVTVLTAFAGIHILFTGVYPRRLFEFNVGVFRWSWRVSFYTTGSFATDRYPPFSLAPDPTYPADLDVDYPEQLAKWPVLVKWWLLALPHLVIVAILSGGWGFGWDGAWRAVGGGGLIAVLALVAVVIRTVKGSYPTALFDLIMGLNRWCYRVLAYIALMTDEYPPFRLDQGGSSAYSATARNNQ